MWSTVNRQCSSCEVLSIINVRDVNGQSSWCEVTVNRQSLWYEVLLAVNVSDVKYCQLSMFLILSIVNGRCSSYEVMSKSVFAKWNTVNCQGPWCEVLWIVCSINDDKLQPFGWQCCVNCHSVWVKYRELLRSEYFTSDPTCAIFG